MPLIGEVRAVTAGADLLADGLRAEQARVDWRPPLERLAPDPAVDAANAEAVGRMLAARPRWVGVGVAADVVPGMRRDLLLHSGPPLRWDAASGWSMATSRSDSARAADLASNPSATSSFTDAKPPRA